MVSSIVGPRIFSDNQYNGGLVSIVDTVVFTQVPPPPQPPLPPPAPKVNIIGFKAPQVVDADTSNDDEDYFPDPDLIGNRLPPDIIEPVVPDKFTDDEDKAILVVEESATFKHGDLKAFQAWISQQIQYPDEAAKLGIEGRIAVSFVIGKTGKIEDIKLVRSADPMLNEDALRVLKTSPDWHPARQGGVVVRQQFVRPLSFSLTK